MLNVGVFTYDFFPFIGGQGRHIHELFKQNEILRKINMYVFSPAQNKYKSNVTIFPEVTNSRLKQIELSYKLHNRIESIIANYKLDLAHFHGGPGGIFLFKKLSVPTVFTSHHTYWQQYHYIKSQYWKSVFYPFEKKGYQFANKIICVSTDTEKILENHYHIDKSKLVVIPNGITINNTVKPKNKKDIKKKLTICWKN